MVKHTEKIRSVLDHFVGLVLKGLTSIYRLWAHDLSAQNNVSPKILK